MSTLFEAEDNAGFARVAVERGVDRYPDGLTYAIPAGMDALAVGERVQVPLGRADTPTAGYVIEICSATELDRGRLKAIARRDAPGTPGLPLQMLELARWISSYYFSPIGMTPGHPSRSSRRSNAACWRRCGGCPTRSGLSRSARSPGSRSFAPRRRSSD